MVEVDSMRYCHVLVNVSISPFKVFSEISARMIIFNFYVFMLVFSLSLYLSFTISATASHKPGVANLPLVSRVRVFMGPSTALVT